jgi:hypothetical protein
VNTPRLLTAHVARRNSRAGRSRAHTIDKVRVILHTLRVLEGRPPSVERHARFEVLAPPHGAKRASGPYITGENFLRLGDDLRQRAARVEIEDFCIDGAAADGENPLRFSIPRKIFDFSTQGGALVLESVRRDRPRPHAHFA